VRVLKQLSDALNLSAGMLLAEAGLLDPDRDDGINAHTEQSGVEHAIKTDGAFEDAQKAALPPLYQIMTRSQPVVD
jgi:hypothetical protein